MRNSVRPPQWFAVLVSLLYVLAAPTLGTAAESDTALHETPALRRPVAMAISPSGETLWVGNRRSGTISTIDTASGRVVRETPVGKQLADLALLPDGKTLLAVDEQAGMLLIIRADRDAIRIVSRTAVSATPVSVAASEDGTRCLVASRWSRRATIVGLGSHPQPRIERVIDLPFCPREQHLLPDGHTVAVADAFGNRLAAIDLNRGALLGVHTFDGHNIRGMTLTGDGKTLLVTHQLINSEIGTTRFAVHWGSVMKNVVRSVPVSRLAEEPNPQRPLGTVDYFGIPDIAAGDPGAILLTREGGQAVAFSGVSEVAVSADRASYPRRVGVGRRPTALVLSPDERQLLVACTFDDSVSVVDIQEAGAVKQISLGPKSQPSLADRGEMLFYDARLARDGWFSCHSCHTDGHTSGTMSDNFSDGSFKQAEGDYGTLRRFSPGGSKRTLSLLGSGDTGPWAWNASMTTLEAQIRKSIKITMQGPTLWDKHVKAIEAYLRTLEPPPSVDRLRGTLDQTAVDRGRRLFASRGCSDCHAPPKYTTPDTYDVGLKDNSGNTQFNPPSLRGISQRDQFFHDNRAGSLREVFGKHQHGLEAPLAENELSDLIHFLRSL